MRARQTIIDALTAGRRVSDAVKPRELATMVRAAIDKEVSLVELGEHCHDGGGIRKC